MANQEIRPIRVEGNVAFITLTQGYTALIDASDVPLVAGRSWFVSVRRGLRYAMAVASSTPRRFDYLHRFLVAQGTPLHVDHINGDGLDNRRANLRLATVSENLRNQRCPAHNTSGTKGVSWHKQRSRWRASIKIHGKNIHLGLFASKEAAAAAYAKASTELHGEFGRTS